MKKEKGLSLIEVVVAIMAIGILAILIGSLPGAISSIGYSKNTSLAREIAGKKMDALRKQPYANLADGVTSFSDSSLTSLPQSSASFEIEPCPTDVCLHNEIAKKVTVKVIWKEKSNQKEADLTTLITEGGLGQ
jgi:prepilin-type N-terminal cleavage/methylation domain-containing protein